MLGDVVQQMVLRQHVDEGRLGDGLRMVETQPVQHARAAVMAAGVEFLEAEVTHDLDLVLRHGAERIGRVIAAAVRLGTVAVAAQVGQHDGEFLRQPRRDLVPGRRA